MSDEYEKAEDAYRRWLNEREQQIDGALLAAGLPRWWWSRRLRRVVRVLCPNESYHRELVRDPMNENTAAARRAPGGGVTDE